MNRKEYNVEITKSGSAEYLLLMIVVWLRIARAGG
jgi:hypothetical protein